MKSIKLTKTVLASLTGGALLLGGVAVATQQPVAPTAPATTVSAQGTANDFEETIVKAVDIAKDAVVSIQNYQKMGQSGNMAYFRGEGAGGYSPENKVDLEDPSASQQLAGEGSGVIYKIEGDSAYLVTNNHVVDNSDSLKVKLADGTTVDGELVGKDATSDLAVVKIPAKDVKKAISFANSDDTKVGSIAIAIGSPLGSKYSNTVTQGIISAVSRLMSMDTDKDGQPDIQATLMQTDAAINPGNSGGALINKNGELIGINSSKFSDVGVEGMGFAIPSNEVQRVITMLEKDGKVTRPRLGIQATDVDAVSLRSRTEILKLPAEQTSGVVITEPVKGGSAEAAGLQKYDVITKINGKEVKNFLELRHELYQLQVGDKVEVTYLREGKENKVSATLMAPTDQEQPMSLPTRR